MVVDGATNYLFPALVFCLQRNGVLMSGAVFSLPRELFL